MIGRPAKVVVSQERLVGRRAATHLQLAFSESNDGDDELDSVSQRGVHDCRAQVSTTNSCSSEERRLPRDVRPPKVCPTRSASSSVPKPRSLASGMMARKVNTKMMVSFCFVKCNAQPTCRGVKGQRVVVLDR